MVYVLIDEDYKKLFLFYLEVDFVEEVFDYEVCKVEFDFMVGVNYF